MIVQHPPNQIPKANQCSLESWTRKLGWNLGIIAYTILILLGSDIVKSTKYQGLRQQMSEMQGTLAKNRQKTIEVDWIWQN